MKTNSLLNTNRYLKDPKKRKSAILTSVASSSLIEGMRFSSVSEGKDPKNSTEKTNSAKDDWAVVGR